MDLQYTNANSLTDLNGTFIEAGAGGGLGVVGSVNYLTSPDGKVTGTSGSFGSGLTSTIATPVSSTLIATTTGTVGGFCTKSGFLGPSY